MVAPQPPRSAVVVPFDDGVATAAQVGGPAVGGAAEPGDRGRLSLRRRLGDEGADVVAEAAGDLGQQLAQATRRGQQAEPVLQPVAGQEADREQAQLGAGEEHDLGPLPAQPLGPFGAVTKQVEQLPGGQVTGEG
jgi:hypothetical protein